MSERLLLDFLLRAKDHPRLGATHISVYAALVGLHQQGGAAPLRVKRAQVMTLAKISPATYHHCLRVLVECGFLAYCPSTDPRRSSEIHFLSGSVD